MGEHEPLDTNSDAEEQHWFKAGLRRLPMPVRLALIGLVAVLLTTLPLLIIFGPWELRSEPPAGSLTGVPRAAAGPSDRPVGWLVFRAGEEGRTLAVDLGTGERRWLPEVVKLPSEQLATPSQIAAMTSGVSVLGERIAVEQFPRHVVIDLPCHVVAAVLSPDGRWLAFQYAASVHQAMGHFGLGIADLGTGQAQRLLPLAAGANTELVDYCAGEGELQWVASLPEATAEPPSPTEPPTVPTPPTSGPVTSF